MESRHKERLQQQETQHKEEMSALIITLQSQLEDSAISLDNRLHQSQKAMQQLIQKSHNTILTQMGEMIKVITELGAHVMHSNTTEITDQAMPDAAPVTPPPQGEKPTFRTPESKAKKPKTQPTEQRQPLKTILNQLHQQQSALKAGKMGTTTTEPHSPPAAKENTTISKGATTDNKLNTKPPHTTNPMASTQGSSWY